MDRQSGFHFKISQADVEVIKFGVIDTVGLSVSILEGYRLYHTQSHTT